MGKKSDLSPRNIGQIRVLLETAELSQKKISRRLDVSQAAVASIKRKIDLGGRKINLGGSSSPKGAGKCGRRQKTTPTTDRWLVRPSQQHKRHTSRQLQLQLQGACVTLNSSTVSRTLLEAGIKANRPHKKKSLCQRRE